jgi:formyl-CoA transferase
LPERSGTHDPPREWAANDAFRKPRGFNQPVKVNAGALAMLEGRRRTGQGDVVNTSLLETALLWAGQKISAYVNMGKLPERHASGHPNLTPYEAFDSADGPVLVCCGNDRLFAKFAAELGHAEWASDERFSTNRARLKHKALMRITPRAEWLERLARIGVPCAPVNSIPEVLAEPQTQALGMVQPVPGEDFSSGRHAAFLQ